MWPVTTSICIAEPRNLHFKTSSGSEFQVGDSLSGGVGEPLLGDREPPRDAGWERQDYFLCQVTTYTTHVHSSSPRRAC